jgi:hypothetical protein
MTLAHQKAAAQRAREAKKAASRNNLHPKNMTTPTPVINAGDSDVDEDPDQAEVAEESDSDCGYTGAMNFIESDSEEEDSSDYIESDDESPSEADLEDDDIWTREQVAEAVAELTELDKPDLKSKTQWKKAEANWKLGYTGNSQRTRQRNAQNARVGAKIQQEAREK